MSITPLKVKCCQTGKCRLVRDELSMFDLITDDIQL